MSIDKPFTLADGPGNPPTSNKWNDNYDWLISLLFGNPLVNGGFENWALGASFTNPGNAVSVVDSWSFRKTGTSLATANITRESTTIDTEVYSAKVAISGAGHADSIIAFDQAIESYIRFRGLNIVCGFRIHAATASKVRVKVYDGVTSAQYSTYHTGGGTWETLQASLTVSASATQLTVSIEISSDFTGNVFIDGAFLYPVISGISDNAKTYLRYYPQIGVPIDPSNVQLTSINGSFLGSFRNRIINGDMRIDQRLAGGNLTASGNGIDRYEAAITTAGAITIARASATPPTGFTHYMRSTCGTADASIAATDRVYITQRIEGSMTRDFLFGSANAKQVTLSFWVRSSLVGIYTGSINNSTRSYPFEYTINTADTWERKSVTLVGDLTGTWPTDNTGCINVTFALMLGSNFYGGTTNAWNASIYRGTSNQVNFMSSNTSRTYDITGVQLELGARATEFEYRPHPVELAMCQRYYEKSYDLETAPGTATGTNTESISACAVGAGESDSHAVRYQVTKRVAPTVTVYNAAGTSGSMDWTTVVPATTSRVTTVVIAGTRLFAVYQSVNNTGVSVSGHWVSNAEI